ncbi:SDR family oxidoreductase [Microbacterium sp. AZCO]|uniref:SDR family oxidoreductase n=1 Tax=Microbacterium sp. AZCO TaxID=3142976 RepID=UPI0031F36D77
MSLLDDSSTSATSLSGEVALVSGASRGLGRHIAVALAAAGARVAINYASSREGAEESLRAVEAAGGEAEVFRGDVTDADDVHAMVGAVEERFGAGVGILVNNATGPQPEIPIEQSTWDDYLLQLEFFVKAPLLLLQAVLPGMRARGAGSVVNIGSEVVEVGNPSFATYVSAKAAMVGLTRSWARELGPDGIRVNLVAPGWIPVERHEGLDTTGYADRVPLGRTGTPAEIAEAVVFLASPASRFITGQSLSVNGGNTFG